ncbi:hypothetical protein [Hyphomicrobium sp.]|uniref:hypothetical protein n=1 Tax=Hyphomicrobium sp. TaxID=82 RepID=UPI002E31FC9E|nr:hypothetical protein [Hyphomicrobium sp.]HEX2839859.1 hypothetical protein [Hyphomicrobium sp.]
MIRNSRIHFSALVVIWAAAVASGSAGAAEPLASSASASGWTFNFTPYGWITWLDGTETVRGRSVDVEVDPIQLIDHLESLPFMGYGEARKGPFAFYGDLVYANVGLDSDSVKSRGLRPGINGALSASLGLDYKQTIAEAGAVYEIAGGQTAIDVLAGARYWHQEANLKLAVDANLDISDLVVSRGIAVARSGGIDWVDPVIGARIRHRIAPGQELVLRGDIGGFGAGSQFSWNVLAAYSFDICVSDGVTYSGVLGYRLLDVDYEQGSGRTRYEYDVLQHGPLSGLTIKF